MKSILKKEMTLSASVLSYLFIAFGLMFLIPGYPILCGVFFVTLGIFQSFQNAREANDLVFSALLPVAKRDVVRGKYLFSCLIELGSLLLMACSTALRMTLWQDSPVYRSNAMMNANLFALGAALLMFGCFNLIFIGGFFRTGYRFGKPFVTHIIVTFLLLGVFEALHHFPGLAWLNAFGGEHLGMQAWLLGLGAAAYALLTLFSYHRACGHFERIDL